MLAHTIIQSANTSIKRFTPFAWCLQFLSVLIYLLSASLVAHPLTCIVTNAEISVSNHEWDVLWVLCQMMFFLSFSLCTGRVVPAAAYVETISALFDISKQIIAWIKEFKRAGRHSLLLQVYMLAPWVSRSMSMSSEYSCSVLFGVLVMTLAQQAPSNNEVLCWYVWQATIWQCFICKSQSCVSLHLEHRIWCYFLILGSRICGPQSQSLLRLRLGAHSTWFEGGIRMFGRTA